MVAKTKAASLITVIAKLYSCRWLTVLFLGWVIVTLFWTVPDFLSSLQVSALLRQGVTMSLYGKQDDAILWYKRAAEIATSTPIAHRLVAKIALLQDNPDVAVTYLKGAVNMRANDTLLIQELSIAYDLAGQYEEADKLWSIAPIQIEELIKRGDVYWSEDKLCSAYRMYRRTLQVDNYQRFDLLFRGTILAIWCSDNHAGDLITRLLQRDASFNIFHVNTESLIQGIDFRWIEPGIPDILSGELLERPLDATYGGLPVNGSALVVIFVERPGTFQLRANFVNGSYPPIKMALDVDHRRVMNISLDRGDLTWQEVKTGFVLSQGLHTISVSMLNDAVDGHDRYAAIGWVELKRQDKF